MGSSFPNRIVKRIIIGVVIAVALVAIVSVIALIVSFTKSGKGPRKTFAEQEQAGLEFGKTIDQSGCIKEGLKRGEKLGVFDFDAQSQNESFVNGCLKSSQPSPGFCEGVPSGLKNIFVDWDRKQCEKSTVFEAICRGIYSRQIEFCEHQ